MVLVPTILVALCASIVGSLSPSEFLARPIPNFAQNLEGQDLVDYVNLVQPFFTAEPSDLSEEEMRARVMDEKFLAEPTGLQERKDEIPSNTQIPESFDARQKWKECESLRYIRNQGPCGICWAVSAASVLSDRVCVQTQGQQQLLLSDADIAFCRGSGCKGGYPGWAFWYVVNNGTVTGGPPNTKDVCKPYPVFGRVRPDVSCKRECQKGYPRPYELDKIQATGAYVVERRNVQKIQLDIMQNGPVQASFDVYKDFHSYKKGVYVHTAGNKTGAHSVKIVGWGVDKTGEKEVPYWIIANSWGPQFGEAGHFRMLRGQNHCGIENLVIGGTFL